MTDREVYIKLSALAEELFRMAEEADTLVGRTGLQHAAATIAGTAKAIYDHAVGGEAH
jgi:hypothetical protein